MRLHKKSLPIAVGVAACMAMGAFAATGYAIPDEADYSYEPTTLGNDNYSNQSDAKNAFTVEGVQYTSQIAKENAETVAEARSLAISIGEDGEGVSPIVVTNSTGKTIKEFTFRASDTKDYPANMLDTPIAAGDKAAWFWTVDYREQTFKNEEGVEFSKPVNYTLQVTFDDGKTAEFHDTNLNGVRTIELCYSPDYKVYYLNRTTITNHTPNRSLFYEVSRQQDMAGKGTYKGTYTSDQVDQHINSAARMGKLAWTATRGDAWMDYGHDPLPSFEDYGIETMLLGEPTGDPFTSIYQDLYWNSDNLTWRLWNNG